MQDNHHLFVALKDHGLFLFRGNRGGKRKIPIIITYRNRRSRRFVRDHTIEARNLNNLISIKCSSENRNRNGLPLQIPRFHLCNIRALAPKIDELSIFIKLMRADFVAISESWLNGQIDSSFVCITGFDLYRLDRLNGRGGGVCAFASNKIPCKRRSDLENPEYECMWLWLRPYRLPRPLSGILVAVLYCPPDTCASKQRDFVQYLIETTDGVRDVFPDCRLVILGDYNNLDVSDLLNQHNLDQVVKDSTRGSAILDLIVINMQPWYDEPTITAP